MADFVIPKVASSVSSAIETPRPRLQDSFAAQRLKKEAFDPILRFIEREAIMQPPYKELEGYLELLDARCLLAGPRSNVLTMGLNTIAAINQILEKHNKTFESGIVAEALKLNAKLRAQGFQEIKILAYDLRPLALTEIEISSRPTIEPESVWLAAKESLKALRNPMFAIMSLSMIGFFMGANIRQFITDFISAQGFAIRTLLIGSLLVYAIYTGFTKYRKSAKEYYNSQQELLILVRKTIQTAVQKVISDQFRLYKNTIDKTIMNH